MRCSLLLLVILTGCASVPSGSEVPNLRQVEPGVWRGGQPSPAGWVQLRALGITNDIKLNTDCEASDAGAEVQGMKIQRFPITNWECLTGGPKPGVVPGAVAAVTPGTFIHCTHGQDRTGVVVGRYRIQEGWTKSEAWKEMQSLGFHGSMLGLKAWWDRQR